MQLTSILVLVPLGWLLLSCSSPSGLNDQEPASKSAELVRQAFFESRLAEVCAGRDGIQAEDAAQSRRLTQILGASAGTPLGPLVKALQAEWSDRAVRADFDCPPGDGLARFREANDRLARALDDR